MLWPLTFNCQVVSEPQLDLIIHRKVSVIYNKGIKNNYGV